MAEPLQVHRAFGKCHRAFVLLVLSCVCHPVCPPAINHCGHLGGTRGKGGGLSLCPASPCLVSCWGDQQDLAARAPGVFPKQHGAGRLGSFALLLLFIVTFFLPISGSADPQMLLMEIWPVYMLILSPLTSGLLFS